MSWDVKPSEFKVELEKVHVKNTQLVEDYVYNYLLSTAPVDTGAYRANIHRTEGAPRYDFNPETKNNREPAPITGAGKLPIFYVTNGAPYAEVIEHGHSTQAPRGVFSLAEKSARTKYGL